MPAAGIAAIARYSNSASSLLSSTSPFSLLSRCNHPLLPRTSFSGRPFHLHRSAIFPALQTLFRTSASAILMSIDSDAPPEGYRPNVGLCLVNALGQVFVARRVDVPDSWQMPQGGVDENEEPRSAALRELQEETGVTSAEIIGEVAEWVTYDFPPDVKIKITKIWEREWNGQAQKWFLFRFNGDEREINLNTDGIERAEFSDWKWASADEVLARAVDFKKPVYEKVLTAFSSTLKWDSVAQREMA